jgi:hypothetical protein
VVADAWDLFSDDACLEVQGIVRFCTRASEVGTRLPQVLLLPLGPEVPLPQMLPGALGAVPLPQMLPGALGAVPLPQMLPGALGAVPLPQMLPGALVFGAVPLPQMLPGTPAAWSSERPALRNASMPRSVGGGGIWNACSRSTPKRSLAYILIVPVGSRSNL